MALAINIMTTANSSPLYPTLSKRHHPKVRTGCITCKFRRVKCDERKPLCKRCSSTGRRCDGYIVLKSLLFEIAEDKDECWGFQYFRNRTSRQLLSFTQHNFWTGLVIRAGYSRAVIRHALIAIASYQESVDHSDELRRLDRKRFALQQYNEAIKCILNAGPTVDPEDVLLASILFAFFDNVRGSLSTALLHLRGATRVLSEWRATHASRNRSIKATNSIVEEHLAPILGHVCIQAATLMPSISAQRRVYSIDLPDCFHTLRESHFYFYKVVHALCGRLQSIHESDPWPYVDQNIVDEGRELFLSWYELFNAYVRTEMDQPCSCFTHTSSCHFELGVSFLRMQYWGTMIRLEAKMYRSETIFDKHLPKFRAVLDCATRLVVKLNTEEAAGVDACLGFRTNYLPVTGFIALKCRDPSIRREAIALMRDWQRAEGMWSNIVSADIAEHVMHLEEAATSGSRPSSCHEILDQRRLNLLCCSFFSYDQKNDRFEISYGSLDPDVVNIRTIRSGIKPANQDLETFWIDRRPEQDINNHGTRFPDDVSGLFQQTVEIESNLWQTLGGREVAEFVERAAASHICGSIKGIQGAH